MTEDFNKEINEDEFEGEPEALPGRVILAFPTPKERVGSIYLPELSQREVRGQARVVDVGPPVTEEDKIFAKMVKRGDVVWANPNYGEPMTIGKAKYRIYRMFEVHGKYPKRRGVA